MSVQDLVNGTLVKIKSFNYSFGEGPNEEEEWVIIDALEQGVTSAVLEGANSRISLEKTLLACGHPYGCVVEEKGKCLVCEERKRIADQVDVMSVVAPDLKI